MIFNNFNCGIEQKNICEDDNRDPKCYGPPIFLDFLPSHGKSDDKENKCAIPDCFGCNFHIIKLYNILLEQSRGFPAFYV